MQVTVNGIRIAYSERGRRHETALLLIHGFPFNRQMWQAQLASLSSVARVIAPDLRGQGDSEVPPGPYTMDQYADDLAGLLDHLDLERAVVAGLSMGGYAALAFWRRHPERVRALGLLNTRAEPDNAEARAKRDASAARMQEVGAEAFGRGMLPKVLAPENIDNAGIAGRVLAMMAVQPVPGLVAALQGMRDRPDSRPLLPTITVPTLVLGGEEDQLIPPDTMRAMAEAIPGARLVIVRRAGHLSPVENPRAVNAALRSFIEEVKAGQVRARS